MNFLSPPQKADGEAAEAPAQEYSYPKQKMPHEIYSWITFKCFDACISNFENKTLDSQE